jgi:endoglucanase
MSTSLIPWPAALLATLLILPAALMAEGAVEPIPSIPAPSTSAPPASAESYRAAGYYPGVNLASAEFGKGLELGRDFVYPREAEFAYFHGKGLKIVRVPFKWERLQPEPLGEFDAANLAEIDRCVKQANDLGMVILLDPHNYGGRKKDGKFRRLGVDPEITNEDFNDLWIRLAKRYQDRPLVWFGLMNEPNKISAEVNAKNMQSALNAIRATGARNLITVPGCSWTGAHSWIKSGNAAAYEGFTDPADNFVFEVHQYLDKDSSGTKPKAIAGAGSQRLLAFTAWAKEHHFRGFLGEVGWDQDTGNTVAQQEGEALLACMDANKDVWVGYTYWAAGPWWPKGYMFCLEPDDLKSGTPVDKPQMAIISQHLR